MKTKILIEKSILFAIDQMRKDIEEFNDLDENKQRAEAIKTLAEAYDIVHRGKKVEF